MLSNTPTEVQQVVINMLISGESFGKSDTLLHCLLFGWLDVHEHKDGAIFLEGCINNNLQTKGKVLNQLRKATSGRDAVFYRCIKKGYLELREHNGMFKVYQNLNQTKISLN